MNTANIAENMDIDEKTSCNVKNTGIVNNLEQQMKNIDQKNLASSVDYVDIARNLASLFESLSIEENRVTTMENIDIEESLTNSREDFIHEENLASNGENIDIEENPVDSEQENAHGTESINKEDAAYNVKIAAFKRCLSRFKEAVESLLDECKNVKKSFQPSNFSPDFLSSEKGQLIMALIKKQNSSLSIITRKLKYWDDINNLTNEDLITLIENLKDNGENPFAGMVKEMSKLLNYQVNIENLFKA